MGQKIQPIVNLDGANIGGEFSAVASMFGVSDPNDLRLVSMRGATLGLFDARGKKLTLSFLEGARFSELQADSTTEVYDDEGQKLPASVEVIQDGEYQVLEINPIE